MMCAAPEPGWRGANRRVDVLWPAGSTAKLGLFDISFEKAGAGSDIKLVWIASAAGLYSYDGYRFRRFGVKDGLPSEFVRCVLATRGGELWVGTDKGAGVFNGRSFDPRGSERGLAGPNVRRIIEDREGAIWFASDRWPNARVRGGITRLYRGNWRAWRTEDGLPSDYVVNQFTDAAGHKFAMTLNGPARLAGERWVPEHTPQLGAGAHWGSGVMTEAAGIGPVLSNGDDVFALEAGGQWHRLGTPPRHQHGLAAVQDRITLAGDTGHMRKAFVEWSGTGWRQVSDEFNVPRGYGEKLSVAPDGSVWYLGFDCLVRWHPGRREWRSLPSAPGPIFSDGKEGVWAHPSSPLSRAGSGLFELTERNWVRRSHGSESAIDLQKRVWALNEGQVERWSGGRRESWTEAETGIHKPLNVAVDGTGLVWVAGRDRVGNGAVAAYDGRLWRRIRAPAFGRPLHFEQAASAKAGIWYLLRDSANGPFRLLFTTLEGTSQIAMSELTISPFKTEMAADQDGNLWIYQGSGPYRLSPDGKWTEFRDLPARRVRAVGFQPERTWLLLDSVLGGKSGLLLLEKGGRRRFFESDITAGFRRSPDGTLVTGGGGKVIVAPPEAGSEPFEIRLEADEQVHSAFRDQAGVYFISTSSQLLQFEPDRVPPETELSISANAVLSGQPFTAVAVARERFLPAGSAGMYAYSWRFDHGPWSPFSPAATFHPPGGRLGLGRHVLAARARDNGQDVDPVPAEASFEVVPLPIQEQAWFLPALLTLVGLLALATSAALNARRRVVAQAGELEMRVAERTASLVEEVSRRSQVEKELRASDQRYRDIVWTAQEGIATIDSKGRCVQANQEFARIFGKPLETLLGRHLKESLDTAAFEVVARLVSERQPEAPLSYDLTISPEGSEPRHVSVCSRPWLDEGGLRCCLVTIIDMTVQKKAEEAIRGSEAYYRLLFESNPNGMYVIDLETYRFLSVNQAACSTYGYSADEFSKMSVFDLQAPENVEGARQRLSASLQAPTHWAWRHRRKDGSFIEVDITAQDLNFQGRRARLILAIDTTERNRAAAALKESEANLARAQQIAQTGSFQWFAGSDPEACAWSDEVHRILGSAKDGARLTLSGFFERVHPEDRAALRAAQASALETRQPVECEHRIERPDGTIRYLRTTAVMTSTPRGDALAGTLQDITEYRLLEEQLRQAQKLESIGRLAGGVAHDFNNLLTVINGYSGRILGRLDPADSLHNEAQQVVHAGKEAAALTRQLLAFSRKQVFRPEAVDLNEAIERSTQMLRRLIGEDIELVARLSRTPVFVLVDPTQLQQVLLNLSVNARDAMPQGGVLTISTSLQMLDERFVAAHPGTRPGLAALLEVSDTGVGMTAETQRRIFEPFFTTKDRTGGTGLGLATVYGIVQQSGGAIEVVSELGQGACFRVFFLRLASAPEAKAAAGADAVPPRVSSKESVLLVEDQREVRDFAASVLRTAGYKVTEAASGPEALGLADAAIASVDLVVTDMIMPGMTGKELASALQGRRGPTQCLPVLFISGYTAGNGAGKGYELLEKPFNGEALLQKVRQVLDRMPVERPAVT